MRRVLIGVVMVLLLVPAAVSAEAVTGSFSFVMGDNDSRNDARNLCHLGAKKVALEKAGVYIEAQTRVENLGLKSQDVLAFTAAVARVEEIGHSFAVTGDQQTVNCTARLVVDSEDVRRRLAQYASDSGLQERVRQQQQRIAELESRISSLTTALRSVGEDNAAVIRRQRQEALLDVRAWSAREDRLQQLKRLTAEYVRIGMTRDKVRAILGSPDRADFFIWSYGPEGKVLRIFWDAPARRDDFLHGDGYVSRIQGLTQK